VSNYPNFVAPDLSDDRLTRKRRFAMLVDGRSVAAASGEMIERQSPGHGTAVSEWPAASAADVGKAIAAARTAFDTGPWPRMSGAERSRIMFRVAELMLKHQEELALIESLEVGKPIAQARGEVAYCADLWSYAAGLARGLEGETQNTIGASRLGLVLREPIGVVGIITPWNFPLIIVSERVPWAIAVGCTTVVKPSEFTSGTTIRLAELALEAGVPPGVFNVVTGYGDPAGQVLAEDPRTDMIAFTGSLRVGTRLAEIAGRSIKRTGLELGGKGPQIVFADADIEAAADGIAFGVYHNGGQCCISGSRLIVHEDIRDELLARVVDISKRLTFGDPLNEASRYGSMISAGHIDKVEGYVRRGVEEGATIVTGGERLGGNGGHYFAPTIFTGVTPQMTIAKDEIFGPVLAALTFRTADEGLSLANDSEYGLSASVWSKDLETALQSVRRLNAGRLWVNSVIDGTPEIPIGGFKKSGVGRELGRYGFDEYSQFKGIHVTMGRPEPWFR
jgi:acyl-CoA reductase-like NAD-dependent aldehyde dehydrogenase